jgi:hypothetical protein
MVGKTSSISLKRPSNPDFVSKILSNVMLNVLVRFCCCNRISYSKLGNLTRLMTLEAGKSKSTVPVCGEGFVLHPNMVQGG